ncbi:MAG: PD40 domain-containing protein, partial [Candidatus Eisenbacteria bacterium]|nr:PD40 domain-containing protein [Candidatus Eisenbacteria bacterium]
MAARVPGLELFPDLSPNGAMLAFSWSGEGPTDIGALDLYVMQLPSGRPTRLVEGPGSVTYPSWSPDGTEIAFALQEATGSTVATVEVLSGEVRRLYSVSGSIEGLDWSPDGEWIVLATTEKETATPELRLLRRSDLTVCTLHDRPPEGRGDFAPVFSPDSRAVAFLRGNDRGEQDAWVVPVAAGPARMVALEGRRVSGIAWLGPKELALSATSKLDVGLWSVHTDSGRRTLLAL